MDESSYSNLCYIFKSMLREYFQTKKFPEFVKNFVGQVFKLYYINNII